MDPASSCLFLGGGPGGTGGENANAALTGTSSIGRLLARLPRRSPRWTPATHGRGRWSPRAARAGTWRHRLVRPAWLAWATRNLPDHPRVLPAVEKTRLAPRRPRDRSRLCGPPFYPDSSSGESFRRSGFGFREHALDLQGSEDSVCVRDGPHAQRRGGCVREFGERDTLVRNRPDGLEMLQEFRVRVQGRGVSVGSRITLRGPLLIVAVALSILLRVGPRSPAGI